MINCAKHIPNKCKADCCGPVPISKELFEKHKDKIPNSVSYDLDEFTFKKLGLVVPITETLSCVFLDLDYKCRIYDDRPDVCKMFGNNKHPRMRCPHR